MKVVLFCGGLGMRLREHSETVPKPMVTLGYRPILWHVMKYYAHFGHKDFILCLGWQGDVIKDYFLNYNECLSNDFVLTSGGESVDLLNSDIHDWRITFVDTGISSNIGQRLLAVQDHLYGEEMFMANYTDGLTDLHLPDHIDAFKKQDSVASFMSVRPSQTFHAVKADERGRVSELSLIREADIWMNGGYFVMTPEIFECIQEGEELVNEPFHRLIGQPRLGTLRYRGFWTCLDTFKEKQALDDLHASGNPPWEVWKKGPKPATRSVRRYERVG